MRNRLSVDVSILRQRKVLQRGESKKREPKTPGALMISLKWKALGKQQAWRSQVQLISIWSARAKEGDSAGRERERERERKEEEKDTKIQCPLCDPRLCDENAVAGLSSSRLTSTHVCLRSNQGKGRRWWCYCYICSLLKLEMVLWLWDNRLI